MTTLNKRFTMTAAVLALTAGTAMAQADLDLGADVNVGGDDGATISTDTGVSAGEDGVNLETENDADLGGNVTLDADAGVGADVDTDLDTETTLMADGETGLSAGMEDVADVEIASLVGTNVYSAEGNNVGEIDGFVDLNGEVMAVVGVGGFFGIGEQDVAISIDNLTAVTAENLDEMSGGDAGLMAEFEAAVDSDAETFMVQGYTEADIAAMTEFDEESAIWLEENTTLSAAMQS